MSDRFLENVFHQHYLNCSQPLYFSKHPKEHEARRGGAGVGTKASQTVLNSYTVKSPLYLLLSSIGTTSNSFPLELAFFPSVFCCFVLFGVISSSLSALLSLPSPPLSSPSSFQRTFFPCLFVLSAPRLIPCCWQVAFVSEFFSAIRNTTNQEWWVNEEWGRKCEEFIVKSEERGANS